MYKLLVVEDEPWVRKALVSKINMSAIEFSSVREASNGSEALDIIKEELPNIVLTDIRMRQMDGLELISRAGKLYPDIKFIIISGYAEFDYAKRAVDLGVCGYLLKPIKDENLEETLKKAVEQLDQYRRNKEIKNKEHVLQRKNNEFIIERQIKNILMETVMTVSEDTGGNGENRNVVPIPGENLMMALIHIDKSSYSQTDFRQQDLELIKFAIKNIAEEICNDAEIGIIAVNNMQNNNQVILIIGHSEENYLKSTLNPLIKEIFDKIRMHLKISIIIAASDIENKLSSSLYKKAMEAFNLRFSYGFNQIFMYDSLRNSKAPDIPAQKFKLLKQFIEMNDYKNIAIMLGDIFSVESLKDAPGGYLYLLYFETINVLISACSKRGIEFNNTLYTEVKSAIDRFHKGEEISQYLHEIFINRMKNSISCDQDCKGIINKAREYIDSNYSEDISFKDLAMKFSMNPSYFSTVFKQEIGVTISKYLMDIRIQKACELLEKTQLSISRIAEMIGYPEIQYFHRVFKKTKGKTPMEYKMHL